MKRYPSCPGIEDAPPELFEDGHLWIREKIDGGRLRFRLRESGAIQFGDGEGVLDPEDVPPPYRRAVGHVRDRLDRDALRAAVEDVGGVTFFGVATYRRTIDYDWDRMPPFLGVDVWSASDDRYLPPDAVEAIYERLGLQPVNAVRKELRARDFRADDYEVPPSEWYDGPAAGVVVRNKGGGRAELVHPKFGADDGPEPLEGTAEELARRYVTDRRLERIVADLRERGEPTSFEAIYGRVLDDVARTAGDRLHGDTADVDPGAFRSRVAALTREFLADGG